MPALLDAQRKTRGERPTWRRMDKQKNRITVISRATISSGRLPGLHCPGLLFLPPSEPLAPPIPVSPGSPASPVFCLALSLHPRFANPRHFERACRKLAYSIRYLSPLFILLLPSSLFTLLLNDRPFRSFNPLQYRFLSFSIRFCQPWLRLVDSKPNSLSLNTMPLCPSSSLYLSLSCRSHVPPRTSAQGASSSFSPG